jgi:DNA-binding NarL/FixJ family response regulator
MPDNRRKSTVRSCPFLCDWAWQAIAASLHLSHKEVDVCRGIFQDQSKESIARKLETSVSTVRHRIGHLYGKLSVSNRAGLIARIVREHMEILFTGGPPATCPLHKRLEDARRSLAVPPKPSVQHCPFLCDWAWQTIAASLGLSDREVEICRCLTRGLQEKEIALDLRMAPETVGCHIDRLYKKLCLHSHAAIVAGILHEHIETLHCMPTGMMPTPPSRCRLAA